MYVAAKLIYMIMKSKIEDGIRTNFAQNGPSYSSMPLKFEPSTSCFICFIVSAICWYRLDTNGFYKGLKLLKMTLTFFKSASDFKTPCYLELIQNFKKPLKDCLQGLFKICGCFKH